jgi:hypothetical protein
MTAVAARDHAPMRIGALVVTPALEALGLSLLAPVVYWFTGPAVQGDVWPPLAEAFLDGQLHLDEDRPWLELVPRAGRRPVRAAPAGSGADPAPGGGGHGPDDVGG